MAVNPQSPTELAGLYLRMNKLPDTPQNRAVLGSWFVKESGKNPTTLLAPTNPSNAITYKNPLGITGNGDLGKGGGTRFASYSSWESGAIAWGSLVKNNYPDIWAGFQSGNPAQTQQAITDSRWVTGKANSNNYAKSGGIGTPYLGLLAIAQKQVNANDPSADFVPVAQENLTGFNSVTFPVGHVLTQSDADSIVASLEAQGAFKNYDPVTAEVAKDQIRSVLKKQVGKPWSRDMLQTIQADLGSNAADVNVLGSNLQKGVDAASKGVGLPGIGEAIAKAPAMIALTFGGILMIVGVVFIFKDQSDMPREHTIFRQTPIIMRGAA